MFGRSFVFFLKFLVHFALAKPTANSDFFQMKDMLQRISHTVLQQTKKNYYRQNKSAVKDSALAF